MKRSWIKPSKKPKRLEEKRLDKLFQQACLLRDHNRCQAPGCNRLASGGVHHLIPRKYKSVRHYMDNGISLCIEHHQEIHEGKDKSSLQMAVIGNTCGLTVWAEILHNADAGIMMGGAEHLERFINENK